MVSESISLVIPTYSRPSDLRRLLDSIARLEGTIPDEILIIDDSPNSETSEMVEIWSKQHEFGVKVIRSSKRNGPAAARNVGLNEAKGEIVAFTDDDCVVDRKWLHELIKPFSEDKSEVIAATTGSKITAEITGLLTGYYSFACSWTTPRRYIDTANCALRKNAALSIGGFDAYYKTTALEDIGISLKLVTNGLKIRFCENAVVYHYWPEDFHYFIRKAHEGGYGLHYLTEMYLNASLAPEKRQLLLLAGWKPHEMGPPSFSMIRLLADGAYLGKEWMLKGMKIRSLGPNLLLWYISKHEMKKGYLEAKSKEQCL